MIDVIYAYVVYVINPKYFDYLEHGIISWLCLPHCEWCKRNQETLYYKVYIMLDAINNFLLILTRLSLLSDVKINQRILWHYETRTSFIIQWIVIFISDSFGSNSNSLIPFYTYVFRKKFFIYLFVLLGLLISLRR